MSYDPSDAIRRNEHEREFLQLLAERHPEARLEPQAAAFGGYWVDPELAYEDCDLLVVSRGTAVPYVAIGKRLTEHGVVLASPPAHQLDHLLEHELAPAFRHLLVAEFARVFGGRR